MKKIILLIITLGLITISIKSQSNLPYKPLSEFNRDTTGFVLYNFMDRHEYYKGKTVKSLADDLQIPIKYIIPCGIAGGGTPVEAILIYIHNKSFVFNEEKQSSADFNCIIVYLDKLINWDEQIKKLIKSGVESQYDFFKNCKIKNIYTIIPHEGKYYDKYKHIYEKERQSIGSAPTPQRIGDSILVTYVKYNNIPLSYDEYSLNDGKLIDVDCIGPEYNKIYYGQIHNHMKQPTSYSIYFRILKKMRIRINHEYKNYNYGDFKILKSAIKDVNTGEEYQLSNTNLSHELYSSTIEIEPGTYVYKSFLDADDSAVWLKISSKCGGSDADDDDDDFIESSSTFNMGNLNYAGSFTRSLDLDSQRELTFTFDLTSPINGLRFQCMAGDIDPRNTMKNISLENIQTGAYNPYDSDHDENFYELLYSNLTKGTYRLKVTITPNNIPSKYYFYFIPE